MADRPIIFSAPMVRALLDGRKTQTRRVLKDVPPPPAPNCAPGNTARHPQPYLDAYCGQKRTDANPRGMSHDWHWWQVDDRPGRVAFRLPYVPGSRLWVRETCRAVEHEDGTDAVEYLADAACARIKNTMQTADQWLAMYHYGARGPDRENREGQKVPSIHMPRWASRLTLTVTDVRVQRLQEISYFDTCAEGVDCETCEAMGQSACYRKGCGASKDAFRTLWNNLHGPAAWDANPWVCAISFDVRRGNIDQVPGRDG